MKYAILAAIILIILIIIFLTWPKKESSRLGQKEKTMEEVLGIKKK
jgi:hypothetical protein